MTFLKVWPSLSKQLFNLTLHVFKVFFLLFSIGLHSLQQPKVGLISQFFWQAENRFKNHKGLPMKSVKNNFECAPSVRPKIKTTSPF